MKKLLTICSLALMLSALAGCESGCAFLKQGSVAEGSDPIVVGAQQLRAEATSAMNTLFTLELANGDALFAINPSIKHTVDGFRKVTPTYIRGLTEAIDSFKVAKNETNATKLSIAVALLRDNLGGVQKAIADTQAALAKRPHASIQAQPPFQMAIAPIILIPMLIAAVQNILKAVPAIQTYAAGNPWGQLLLNNLSTTAAIFTQEIPKMIEAAKRNSELTDAEEAQFRTDFEQLVNSDAWQIRPDPIIPPVTPAPVSEAVV